MVIQDFLLPSAVANFLKRKSRFTR